jgi:hypothetical protein
MSIRTKVDYHISTSRLLFTTYDKIKYTSIFLKLTIITFLRILEGTTGPTTSGPNWASARLCSDHTGPSVGLFFKRIHEGFINLYFIIEKGESIFYRDLQKTKEKQNMRTGNSGLRASPRDSLLLTLYLTLYLSLHKD